jgi:hypothetical protein
MYCWANDIAAARLDGAFRPVNLRDVIASCETGGDASRVMLAIRQRSDPKIIGYINIHNSTPFIARRTSAWGSATTDIAATASAKRHCWNHLNLERVGLVVFRHNARAIAAYSACGFKKEGVLKRFLFVDGAWIDLVLMAAFRPVRKRARSTGPKQLDAIRLPPNDAAAAAWGRRDDRLNGL